jgi:hypothetical protein
MVIVLFFFFCAVADSVIPSRQDQGSDRSERISRHLLQQVSGESRLRPPQAEWPVRHHARDGAGVRRSSARRKIQLHWPGDEREDELARPSHRPRYAQSDAGVHAANFGKAGAYYYWISRGVDNREVRANRIRKSVGAENTFSSDLTDFDAMAAELQPLIDKVWRHCEDKGSRGRTVTLKVKFNDFEIITRSRSVPFAVSSRSDLERLSIALLQNEMPFPRPVRLLGVSLSSLQGDEQDEPQLGLPI